MKGTKGLQRAFNHPFYVYPWKREKWAEGIRVALRRRRNLGLRQGVVAHGESNLFGHLNDMGRIALKYRDLGLSVRATARALGWSRMAVWRFWRRHPRSDT